MNLVRGLADKRPLILGLLTLLAWIILAGVITGTISLLLDVRMTSPFVQVAGTLSATFVLLLITHRLGWMREIGITAFGTLPVWGLTLVVAVYITITGFYAFFGNVQFAVSSLVDTPQAREILLQTLLVGFVEETVFRGFLLYVLVRGWGQTRRGLVAAVVVQAALFGTLHALQVLAGAPLSAALANVLATFVFGLWLGSLVLCARTIWPAVLLHFVANAFVLIKGLSSPWVDPSYTGYLLGAALDLPLVMIGFWYVLKALPVRPALAQNERTQEFSG